MSNDFQTHLPIPANAPNPESSLRYPGWQIVLAGFFGVMVSFAAIVPYTFGLFIKPLAAEFGWGRGAISAGFTITALTVAAASPGLGFLLDRFSPRSIILPCITIFAVTLGSLFYLTPNILHFYLSFLVIGFVGNGTAYIGYTRAISTWFNARRGLALSVMLAGSACGAMILPNIAQSAITHFGWRNTYLLLGVIAFVIGFPLAALLVREKPLAFGNTTAAIHSGASVAKALKTHTFWIIAGTVCLYAISVNGAIAHLSALLTDRGVSAWGAAFSVSVIGGTGLVGRILTGFFLDRFFGPRISQIMLLMTVTGIVMLSLANNLTAGMIAAALIGFSMGSEGDITPYLLSRYFGLKRFSTLYALTWTTYAIGAATGPILVGRVFDTLGSYRSITIQLLALPALIPCLLMFLLPRYSIHDSSPELSATPPLAEPIPAEFVP